MAKTLFLENSETVVVMTHDGNCYEVFLQFTDMNLGILKMSRTLFVSVFSSFYFVNSSCFTFSLA